MLGCHGNLLAAEESAPPLLLPLRHLPSSKLAKCSNRHSQLSGPNVTSTHQQFFREIRWDRLLFSKLV